MRQKKKIDLALEQPKWGNKATCKRTAVRGHLGMATMVVEGTSEGQSWKYTVLLYGGLSAKRHGCLSVEAAMAEAGAVAHALLGLFYGVNTSQDLDDPEA